MTLALDVRYERQASKTKLAIEPEWLIIMGQLLLVAITIPAAILASVWLP